MFGCIGPGWVLQEVEGCRRVYPLCDVRLATSVKQAQLCQAGASGVDNLTLFYLVLCQSLLHLSLVCHNAAPVGVLLACCRATALPCPAP